MSAAASFISRSGPSIAIRNMSAFSKPHIEIVLAGSQRSTDAYIDSYSTLDEIKGTVKIIARHDTRFDDLEIAFVGVTKTFVDKLASATAMGGRQEAVHRFLKLTQPIPVDQLPQPRILEAGKTYEYPFTFAVPEQLLPKACGHKNVHDGIQQAHMQVPPSLGDADLSGFGGLLLDDMAPAMSKIQYAIRVMVLKSHPTENDSYVLAEAHRKLRVKPAFEEQPPLDMDAQGASEDYILRQEKTIRKGMFKGKLGKLVMESSQPKGFRLPAIAARASAIPPVATKVKIALRFDPADENCLPPQLESLGSKLKVATYFASTPRRDFPIRSNVAFDGTLGYISEFLNLSSMCVASVQWQKHDSWESPSSRRDSASSNASSLSSVDSASPSVPEPSSSYKGNTFYTATILVPLSLPTHKNLVPTFHSCLVSRVYGIHVNLSCGGQAMAPSVTLKLPIQISSEGSVSSAERRRQSMFAEQAALEADAEFVPRTTAPPPDFFLNQSRLPGARTMEPPSYSAMPFNSSTSHSVSVHC